MNIDSKQEAAELFLALVARKSVLQARLRNTRTEKGARVAKEKLDCVTRMVSRVNQARVANPRMLKVGEIIEAGDEVLIVSSFEGDSWKPVKYTIGRPVRPDEVGSFRRP